MTSSLVLLWLSFSWWTVIHDDMSNRRWEPSKSHNVWGRKKKINWVSSVYCSSGKRTVSSIEPCCTLLESLWKADVNPLHVKEDFDWSNPIWRPSLSVWPFQERHFITNNLNKFPHYHPSVHFLYYVFIYTVSQGVWSLSQGTRGTS